MSAIAPASIATRAARRCALRHSPLALALAVALGAVAPGNAAAQVAATQLPIGGSIAGGTGTINPASGATLTIDQTSSRMALNWSAFDIGSVATVTFNQPSTSAAVLNLVQGGNPTQIFGNVNANGQVFLINPNGIIFGSTAQFNVGGLVASTLGTTASDFMSGNDVLDAGGNMVALMSNSGTINAAAGAVDLIGGKVVNSGTINATAGNINLVGADKVTLTFESGGFGVVVDKALQLQLDSVAVENSNVLSAPGGIVTLQARAAQGLFDQLINNSGTITAAALNSGSDGSVSLVANGGGQTGIGGSGSIDVGSGAINISTDRSVQQSGIYTAGTLGGSIGGDASFSGSNHIAALASLSVDGNLSLSNAIDLTQSGALTVGGSSSFSLGSHALTLDDAGNDFGQTVSLSAGSTTIADSGALTLGTLATGNLTATSTGALNLGSGAVTGTLAATSNGGAITQSASGPLTVTGTSNLDAGIGAITLQQTANDFGGAVSLTGSGVTLTDSNALTIAALTLGNNSALSLNAAGTLTLPSSAIDTGNANLSLHSGNVLATAAALSGTNVSLSGDDGITLAHDVTATGPLMLTAVDSAITQSAGALAVTGTSHVDAGSGAITLTGAGNHFGQAVSLTGGTTQITDSGALTLGALATGNFTATSNGALNLGSGTVTGTLAAISNGGAITQSASDPLTITGTSTLDAGSGAITLQQAGNDFGGAVSLTGSGIALADANVLTIAALTLGNNSALSLYAGGTLTLPGSEIDTGNANLNLHSGNVLTTTAALSGADVSLSGDDGITLAHDVTATGTLALTTVDSAIAQSAGALTVSGTSGINAGSGAIALTGAGNHFGQAVSLTGGTTQITDSGALTFGTLATGNLTATSNGALKLGSGTVTGTLNATSNGGVIGQTAALTVTGNADINAGSGAIDLGQANDFQGVVRLTGADTAIADRNALTLGNLATGNLTVTSNGVLNLGGGTVTGTLDAASNGGAIEQTAALTVSGNADFVAGNGAITLDQANAFQGSVGLTGGNATLTNAGALTLAASTLGGNLIVDANGDIAQNGALRVDGTSSIQAHGNAIGLGGTGNDFQGMVSLAGGAVTIADSNALLLGSLATGNLTATSNGALNLGSGTVTGSLTAISNGGAITQSASNGLTVTGTSDINAGTGSITLTTTGNDFGDAVDLTGGITAIADSNALLLGNLATGNLTAASNGAL
ncbi:filamentous hemagglutinin N-terminal domain-containing protein, partial [Xanthomonas sp. 1678]|uniref:beta strand repeat-containing protein n=1 Tax=Xanthomonas sp. 1678 TaxID=3158788 RepID=UPI0028589CE7|nr:filamentous hemagglutinin family protein [Xanthomonas translucens]